jgi:dTDP-4-amino-4,6-dideoxygalactose transaminase
MIPIGKPVLGNEEKRAVMAVLDSGMLAQGKVVAEFERQFAEYVGAKFAIAVGNGTQALHTAYLAVGMGRGDSGVAPDLTFAASATPMLHIGAVPALADVEEDYFGMDAGAARALVGKRTKMLAPVHLYGHPVDLKPLMELAREKDLWLVEDACQAHGAEYRGKRVGSIGDIACFSFYPTKNMTTGEGGMITTNNAKLADLCKLIRNHGQEGMYSHMLLGYNYHMTEIAAAIGIEQLKKLPAAIEYRRKLAKLYNEELDGVVRTPTEAKWGRHVYHQYTIRVKKGRDKLAEALAKEGIGSRVYYPVPLHTQKIMKGNCKFGKNANVARLTKEVLSIPVHPSVTFDDAERIAGLVKKFAKGGI